MRKIFLISVIVLTALSVDASKKNTVSLVKQYSDTSFVLPQKTIEKKMKCVIAKKPDFEFPQKLRDTLNMMQKEDYGNRVFTMLLTGSGKGIKIAVKSEDILDNDTTQFFGDFEVGDKHFVMIQNENNIELLNIFFKKTGDTVLFQRLFEKTDNVVSYLPSSLDAFYNEYSRKLIFYQYIINGENLTNHKKVVVTSNDIGDDDDDAFKLDVELFE